MAAQNKVTLGLSSHRPEMIPLVSELMSKHDAIFLEEPSATGFDKMLSGNLAVREYLLPLDVEFAEFSQQMCDLLKTLKTEGKKIFQVEPFLEVLSDIHDFFADGHGPGEIEKDSIQYPVYLAEKRAAAALLTFYQAAAEGDFNETLRAVRRFARADAARFRLRDSLRSQELVRLVTEYPSAYIEAGEMHYPLFHLLLKGLPKTTRVKPIFTYQAALGESKGKGHIYGPGDQLTLLYIYHPAIDQPMRETILAARSLIHSKLVTKEELTHDLDLLPHLRNELHCNRLVSRLSLCDCRRLFSLIRRADTQTANRLVVDYLDDKDRTSH